MGTLFKNQKGNMESAAGGERSEVVWRLDLLPPAGVKAVGEILAYGAEKYDDWNWLRCNPDSEQSGLNHGLGHGLDACVEPLGSSKRIDDLARMALNALMQIEMEMRDAGMRDECIPKFLTTTGQKLSDSRNQDV